MHNIVEIWLEAMQAERGVTEISYSEAAEILNRKFHTNYNRQQISGWKNGGVSIPEPAKTEIQKYVLRFVMASEGVAWDLERCESVLNKLRPPRGKRYRDQSNAAKKAKMK